MTRHVRRTKQGDHMIRVRHTQYEMNLVAIDPGKRTGWAVFRHRQLMHTGYVTPYGGLEGRFFQLSKIPMASHAIIEQPRWYPHERKIDVNDLLDLAVLVGEIKAIFEERGARVDLVFPRTWKGTVPKPIMSQRIYERLELDERKALPLKRGHITSERASDHDHNVLDAVGLGLWKLGRGM